MIARRAFLKTVARGLLAGPLTAEAQSRQRIWHIGWLDLHDPADDFEAPFVRELRDLGYHEGRTLVLDVRNGAGEVDRLPTLAADLVRRAMDLIVALQDLAIRAATQATRTIPIVMLGSADPVGLGFVASLGRPGDNVTGLTSVSAELAGKQLDLLTETVPRVARVTVLTNATVGAAERATQRTRQAAQALGVDVGFEAVRGRTGVEHVFAGMAGRPPDALLVLDEGLLDRPMVNRIAQLARTQKIPLISGSILMTYEGGLLSYGVSYAPQARRAAWYADKILRGAKPADLPVEQPTEFQLVINLKTAKALGLRIPQSLLQRADQVIE